jgi:hypothetical protein
MAIALTLGLDTDRSAAVKFYFEKFKVLPPKALIVSETKILSGQATFETLLNGILAEKNATDFVIVTHGHETGNGLFLKLATRNNAPVGFDTTNEMLQILMDISGRTPPNATSDERTKLQLGDAEIKRLLDLMTKVRDKKLGTVEFRGCNLGRNASSVTRFRAFLGCKTFGAPNLHSFFGKFPTGTGSTLMGNHSTTHSGTTFTFTQTLLGKTCHCCIGINDQKKPQNGHIIADDATTLDGWIKANFDVTGAMGKDKQMPIHGLWEFPKSDPNDPLPVDLPPRPIFPLTIAADGANKGKNEYALHVVYKS